MKISILPLYSNRSVLWKDGLKRSGDVLEKAGLRKCEKEVILKCANEIFPFFNRDVLALIHIEMCGLIMGLGMQNVNLKCGPHGCLKITNTHFQFFISSSADNRIDQNEEDDNTFQRIHGVVASPHFDRIQEWFE